MKALALLAILPVLAIASPVDEKFLNALSHAEGQFLVSTLQDHQLIINQSMRKDFMVRAYPSYAYEKKTCRDLLLVKANQSINGSACKIAGDWIFFLD